MENDFIRKNKIDFAVTGTKGTRMVKNVMMGRFAPGLIKHVPAPVIAVPPNPNGDGNSNILYLTDMEDTL